MKRDPIRIFGILASAAFALFVIAGFSAWNLPLMDWRRLFSYLLMFRLLGSAAVLLLVGAFAFLLKASKFRHTAILGIAGVACLVLGEVGSWTQWLGGDRLLEGFQMFLMTAEEALGTGGWFCLFLAIVQQTEMCRRSRICALVGFGGKILLGAAWTVLQIALAFYCVFFEDSDYSFAFAPWDGWLNASAVNWVDLSFSILLLVAFFSLALGKLRPQGERVVFAFEGRARRKEYWMWMLWCTLFVNVVLAIPVYSILFIKCPTESRVAALWLWWITSGVVMELLTLPVRVRRLHDRNLSGWWLLLFDIGMLIPVVNVFAGIAYFVIVGCLDGTVGPNDYGDDPKGRKAVASAPVSNATPVAAQGILGTPEDRLVKIRELYEKGLLTEAEYNLKRAAIISEV